MSVTLPINVIYREKGVESSRQAVRHEPKPSKDDKKQTTLLGGMSKSLAGIFAIAAIIASVIKPILDLVNALVAIVATLLIKPLAGIITMLMDSLSALSEFLSGEISFGALLEKVGSALWELLMSNPYIQKLGDFMIWLWDMLVAAWDVLKYIGQWIKDNIITPGWEVLKSVGQWIMDNIITPGWEVLKSVGQWIMDNIITPGWNILKSVGSWIWDDIIKPAWETVATYIKGAWSILSGAFSFLANKIRDLVSKLNPFKSDSSGGGGGSRAFGGVIPKDGLYMMHAGENVGRGNTSNATNNSFTVNVNVNGGSSVNAQEIARAMSNELRSFGRW